MQSSKTISRKYLPTPAFERICRILLYTLVTTLIFEGIVRKLVPSVVGLIVFFFKDVICILSLFFISNKYSDQLVFSVKQKWVWVCFALLPLIIYAFVLDPALSVFAAKQYMLYTVVVLLGYYGFFQNSDSKKLKNFLFYFSLLLIPTGAIAMLQNALPASSWINQGVGGTSLEGFSAGGFLRVSSTFSFTGQYSYYLNAAYPLMIAYMALTFISSKKITIFQIAFWLALIVTYIISIFITGGRSAVLGAGAISGIAFFLLLLKRPLWILINGIVILVVLSFLLGVLQNYKPEYFAAYTERSSGSVDETHEEEVQDRVTNGLTDWSTWFWKQDFSRIMIGNGMGVMSNGSEQLSSYAKQIRASGFWTEGDTATIFWEGGIYLAIIWYGFRLFVIFLSFQIYWSFKESTLNLAGAFLSAYIMLIGLTGTLSLQPPMAIWWWLSVSILICLKLNEASILINKKKVSAVLNKKLEQAPIY